MAEPLLDVQDLQVSFVTEDGVVRAVDGVSFTLDRGEVVAIVGESGSGKSVTVMTLMGLTRSPNSRFAGSARLQGGDLITASEAELERVRGQEIAMIFQDPTPSLSPVRRSATRSWSRSGLHETASQRPGARPCGRPLGRVGHPPRAGPSRRLPARVLRRHAAARHDRDGASPAARGAASRRAHHRPRRHHPGPDPEGDQAAEPGEQQRRHLRHPRSRRGGRHRRPGARHVLRTAGRAGHRGRDLLRPSAPLHLGAHGVGHPGRP